MAGELPALGAEPVVQHHAPTALAVAYLCLDVLLCHCVSPLTKCLSCAVESDVGLGGCLALSLFINEHHLLAVLLV